MGWVTATATSLLPHKSPVSKDTVGIRMIFLLEILFAVKVSGFRPIAILGEASGFTPLVWLLELTWRGILGERVSK